MSRKTTFRWLSLFMMSWPVSSFAEAPPSGAAARCPEAAQMRAAGFDQDRLCSVLQGFFNDRANFHSLVIERHGVVAAQAYKRGKDKSIYSLIARETDFDASRRHDLRSISKSITSLLWGIAQGQNKTPALATPVLELFPDLKQLRVQGRQFITIGHLLNMSSGLEWNEPATYNTVNEEFGLYWHSSQENYLFNRPMLAPPGQRFNYNGGGTAVLAHILAQRVGMPLPDYARKFLFEPLGISDWEWKNDLRGRALAFSGLRMRPVDLARIGRMVLQRGQWQGRQVVPADWIGESMQPRLSTGDGLQYGYQWWAGNVDAAGRTYEWHAGFGNGGQRLYMVPGLDLVVVMTAGDYNSPYIGRLANQLLQSIAAATVE